MLSLSQSAFLGLVLSAVAVNAQVPAWGQCGGNGYTGSKTCVSGYTCQFTNEWYSQCVPGSGGGASTPSPSATRTTSSTSSTRTTSIRTTSTANTGGSGPAPTGVTTVFPNSAGATSAPTAIVVSGSFDGKMMKYDRNPSVCRDQSETGEKDAMFILNDGATLSNVIIGPGQAEGVHCKGTCTLQNVWWLDVCEDAATFKQSSGTSYVIGGGATSGSDKIFQHNGGGTVSIKNFFANASGKLYRSCGNCSTNGMARHVIIDNVIAKSVGTLAGINTNYGDTARISNTCSTKGNFCDRFRGTTSGEPSKIGSGPDNISCFTTNVSTNC